MRVRAVTACLLLFVGFVGLPGWASGEGRPDPTALLAAQRAAIARLAFMDGIWRGPAWTIRPSGEKHSLVQTERIGPFLGGAVKAIEGRGYDPDGSVGFNALGIVSYDSERQVYNLHSYAQGQVGDFLLTPSDSGYVWEIPAGSMTIRYRATIKDGAWREVGDRIVPGKDPVRFFEMNLTRVGDTDWPAAGAISPE
jgi:hypothetical protein